MSAAITERDVVAFIYREARLLDERDLEAWYALYADDAIYWVPATPGQTDETTSVSHAYEDKLLLRLRIDRLSHARAYSQKVRSRSLHVLQAPEIVEHDAAAGRWLTRTSFVHVESQGDRQFTLAGVARHTLTTTGAGGLQIRKKRIDLLNCDAALPSIETFL
jgi:3-phenylpropionate/cinnamic acid dioxygenase small subunit